MARMTVRFGQLAKPLSSSTIAEGTTLERFLENRNYEYSSSVRVNGRVVGRDSELHDGNIVTMIESVEGG